MAADDASPGTTWAHWPSRPERPDQLVPHEPREDAARSRLDPSPFRQAPVAGRDDRKGRRQRPAPNANVDIVDLAHDFFPPTFVPAFARFHTNSGGRAWMIEHQRLRVEQQQR
jgi:hypothetical protein